MCLKLCPSSPQATRSLKSSPTGCLRAAAGKYKHIQEVDSHPQEKEPSVLPTQHRRLTGRRRGGYVKEKQSRGAPTQPHHQAGPSAVWGYARGKAAIGRRAPTSRDTVLSLCFLSSMCFSTLAGTKHLSLRVHIRKLAWLQTQQTLKAAKAMFCSPSHCLPSHVQG